MNFVVKTCLLLIGIGFLNAYPMMKEVSVRDQIIDLSQALQKISLRDYEGKGSLSDNTIKSAWYHVITRVDSIVQSDSATYKDLKPIIENMKDLSNDLFDAAMTGNADFRDKKIAVDRLSKKQAQVKRFLLGQKAKSFFSFGKKQDEYKKMRQLLLGMIDMLNAKIDLVKQSVKSKNDVAI